MPAISSDSKQSEATLTDAEPMEIEITTTFTHKFRRPNSQETNSSQTRNTSSNLKSSPNPILNVD